MSAIAGVRSVAGPFAIVLIAILLLIRDYLDWEIAAVGLRLLHLLHPHLGTLLVLRLSLLARLSHPNVLSPELLLVRIILPARRLLVLLVLLFSLDDLLLPLSVELLGLPHLN